MSSDGQVAELVLMCTEFTGSFEGEPHCTALLWGGQGFVSNIYRFVSSPVVLSIFIGTVGQAIWNCFYV